jgi:hypothetical protein
MSYELTSPSANQSPDRPSATELTVRNDDPEQGSSPEPLLDPRLAALVESAMAKAAATDRPHMTYFRETQPAQSAPELHEDTRPADAQAPATPATTDLAPSDALALLPVELIEPADVRPAMTGDTQTVPELQQTTDQHPDEPAVPPETHPSTNTDTSSEIAVPASSEVETVDRPALQTGGGGHGGRDNDLTGLRSRDGEEGPRRDYEAADFVYRTTAEEPPLPDKLAAIRAATDVLRPADEVPRDDFAAEAAMHVRGLLDQIRESSIEPNQATPTRLRIINAKLGEYAVNTGDDLLARIAFDNASGPDKWLLYAIAQESSALDTETLGDWGIALDHLQSPVDAETNVVLAAARELAQCQMELQTYRAPLEQDEDPDSRLIHRQNALNHRQELSSLLEQPGSRFGVVTYDPFNGARMATNYQESANLAFAIARVPEGVRDQPGAIRKELRGRAAELTAKALAGQLTRREGLSLALSFGSRAADVLLWINLRRQDIDEVTPHLRLSDNLPFTMQRLLERGAPDLMDTIRTQPTSFIAGIRMGLEANRFHSAQEKYQILLERRQEPVLERMQAALLMSQYSDEVLPASGALEVYAQPYMDNLNTIEAVIREQGDTLPIEWVKYQLDVLYRNLGQVQEPTTSFEAYAKLLTMYTAIVPESPRPKMLEDRLQQSWTAFENREMSDAEMIRLRDVVQGAGLHFVKDWKVSASGAGYIGYRLLSPGSPNREDARLRQPGFESGGLTGPIADAQATATELNELIGTERYRILDTPQSDHGWNAYNVEHIIEGREPEILSGEVALAFRDAVHIAQRGTSLNGNPELSARLSRIVEPENE